MPKVSSYAELKEYLKFHPLLNVGWYGPKSTDISELSSLLSVNAIISCYHSLSKSLLKIPVLTNDTKGKREKCSVDDLASKFILKEELMIFLEKYNIKAILPYDTTIELENFCEQNKISLFSSPDALKDKLRDKTKIDSISNEINLPTIPGVSGFIDDFEYAPLVERFGLPLFLHFAEGAGGSGNRIVNNLAEFEDIKFKEKGKKLNVKKYFVGKSCSIDICVTKTSVICGTLEEMLIGAEPLNSNPTEYVGSSWFGDDYSYEVRKRISDIGVALGNLLRTKGFLGFFHPDFLVNDNEIFLTELNMRFGGSCGTYAKIQLNEEQVPLMLIHALSFYDPNLEFNQEKLNEKNLSSLDYSLLVVKNNFGRPVKISHKCKSGLYLFSKDSIEFTGKTMFSDLMNKNEIFINGLPSFDEDTAIEPGAFICEIITRFPTSDGKSKLNLDGKILVKRILSQIEIIK